MGIKISELPVTTAPTNDDIIPVLDKADNILKGATIRNIVGSAGVVGTEITQHDYDLLPTSEKESGMYFITDGYGGLAGTVISYADFINLTPAEQNSGSYIVTGMNPQYNAYGLAYKDGKNVGQGLDQVTASLTDNGVNFNFGFDTTSSTYGYYTQEGDFMSFGSSDAKYIACFAGGGYGGCYTLSELQYNNGGYRINSIAYSATDILDNDYCTITFAYIPYTNVTVVAKKACTLYDSRSAVSTHLDAGDTTTISIGPYGEFNGISLVFYD